MSEKVNQIIASTSASGKTIDYRYYFDANELAAITHEVSIMETPAAASIEALKVVQDHRGWISDDSLTAIAQCLRISTAELEGVATFYNLIYRQPVGSYVIHVCDSIACHLASYEQVLASIKAHLSIDYGQTTPDGLFTLLSNACLGNCDKAPAIMINRQHYHSLCPDTVVELLAELSEQAQKKTKGEYDG